MEERQRHSINLHRTTLISGINVDSSLIIDALRSKRLLTIAEVQRIHCRLTPIDKARELLSILESKPDPTVFPVFIECLGKYGLEHLGNVLKRSAEDWTEDLAKNQLETWLKDNYKFETHGSVGFTRLFDHACANDLPVGTHGRRLREVIAEVFPESKLKLPDIGQAYLPHHAIENLSPIDGGVSVGGDQLRISAGKQGTHHSVTVNITGVGNLGSGQQMMINPMEDWDVEKLCDWVSKSDLPTGVKERSSEVFRREDIDGSVFGDQSFPKLPWDALRPLTFGNLSKLITKRDAYFSQDVERNSNKTTFETTSSKTSIKERVGQTSREFGSDTHNAYKKGSLLQISLSESQTPLIPIHLFVDTSKYSKEQLIYHMVEEILQFASACLNDRQNGTLHFGVSPEGLIHGITLAKSDLAEALAVNMSERIPRDVQHAVRYCVSPPQFIEVTDEGRQQTDKYVVEIDIIPSAQVCRTRSFFVQSRTPEGQLEHENPILYRFEEGKPVAQYQDSIKTYLEKQEELSWKRGKEEQQLNTNRNNKPYLRERILELIYRGDPKSMTDIYPVLLIGPRLKENGTFCSMEDMSFIKNIDWKFVLDFGDNSELLDHIEHIGNKNMLAVLLDRFSLKDRKESIDVQDEIMKSGDSIWIFANGHSGQTVKSYTDPFLWRKERGQAFQESLKFVSSLIPEDRALIVIALPGNENGIVTEVACDMCNTFPDQFAILADDGANAVKLNEELIHRHIAEQNTIERVTLVDVSWMTIQSLLEEFLSPPEGDNLTVPHSEFGPCDLEDYEKSRWTDLEILGSNQCEQAWFLNHKEKYDAKRLEVEDHFYKGQEVSWWNFFFEDQVMTRHIFVKLDHLVDEAMEGKLLVIDHEAIACVTLYHQPGSGGTTVAKNILWKRRKQTRCVVVKIRDVDKTADQLLDFRNYMEKLPGPVLVMLDNQDDDKVGELVLKTHERVTPPKNKKVAFVFLKCSRSTDVPGSIDDSCVALKQELHQEERLWLQDKSHYLKQKYIERKGMDPQFLISFNILKEGFDPHHITQTVKRLLTDIRRPKERKLLKYIAFLDKYDLRHRPIPAGAFHNMMHENQYASQGIQRNKALGHWETCLSYPLLILLNQTKVSHCGSVRAFGIIHPLLSNELLKCLMSAESQKVGDVALELMKNREIRFSNSYSQRELCRLLVDILKQRDRGADGKLVPFSPLIQAIKKEDGPEKTIQVLVNGFEFTNDAFVAQLIARLFIRLKNWTEAQHYVKKAIDRCPDNSYLHDTCAQIFLKQIEERKRESNEGCASLATAGQIIDLGLQAQHWLFQVTRLSRAGYVFGKVNNAGLYGEIKVFLDIMHYMEPILRHMGHCGPTQLLLSNIPIFPQWKHQNTGNSYVDILRKMGHRANCCIQHLDDESVQVRSRYSDKSVATQREIDLQVLDEMKKNMARYYGHVQGGQVQPYQPTEEQYMQRRSMVYRHGNSLRSILQLQRDGNDGKLRELHGLYMANVNSRLANADDCRGLLNVIFAMHSRKISPICKVTLRDLIHWSDNLYEQRDSLKEKSLEPFMYYCMMNWPGRKAEEVATPTALKNCLKNWEDVFKQKYLGNNDDRIKWRQENIWFMFSQGTGLDSFIYYRDIRNEATQDGKTRMRNKDMWQTPVARGRLERFQGILNQQGDCVNIKVSPHGNVQNISLSASHVVSDRQMRNKTVSFVIGFTWAGPKAFDITSGNVDSPRQRPSHQSSGNLACADVSGEWGTLMDEEYPQ